MPTIWSAWEAFRRECLANSKAPRDCDRCSEESLFRAIESDLRRLRPRHVEEMLLELRCPAGLLALQERLNAAYVVEPSARAEDHAEWLQLFAHLRRLCDKRLVPLEGCWAAAAACQRELLRRHPDFRRVHCILDDTRLRALLQAWQARVGRQLPACWSRARTALTLVLRLQTMTDLLRGPARGCTRTQQQVKQQVNEFVTQLDPMTLVSMQACLDAHLPPLLAALGRPH